MFCPMYDICFLKFSPIIEDGYINKIEVWDENKKRIAIYFK